MDAHCDRLRESSKRTKQEPLFEIEKDEERCHPLLTNRGLPVRRSIGIGLNHDHALVVDSRVICKLTLKQIQLFRPFIRAIDKTVHYRDAIVMFNGWFC